MFQSRRDFVIELAMSGTLAAASPFSYAKLKGAEIKIGYSAIAWNDQDTRAIDDVSALGVPGIQLRANVLKEFPDPHALRDLLGQHHLEFVALSSGTAPLDPVVRQSTIEEHVKHAQYLLAAGGRYLQIVAASSKGKTLTADDFNYEGQLLTDIAKPVSDLGIQTSLHNHMGTMAQTPKQLDAVLNAADARYVKLELDTAHYLQGGGDPASAVRQYGRRLLFLHLKDVKSAPTASGYEFAELGQGRVNFPALFAALGSIHFRGWGIIELDGPRPNDTRTPRESAEVSKRYLEKLGVLA